MARTSKSRGKTNFKLDNSPYPILKGLRKGLKNVFNASPVGQLVNKIGGGGNETTLGGKLDSINEKLDQLTSGDSGSADAVIGGNQNIDANTMADARAKKEEMKGGDSEEEILQTNV